MKQPVVLKVYRDGKLETVKQFEDRQIVIGREGDLGLILGDDSVSLLHTMIEEREDGVYTVTDLGSKTGTIRNGIQILEESLRSGDELQIGIYRVQFSAGAPKPVAAQPPPVPKAVPPQPIAKSTPIVPPGAIPPKAGRVELPSHSTDEEDTNTEIVFDPDAMVIRQPAVSKAAVPKKPSHAVPSAAPQKKLGADLIASPGRKHKTFAPPSSYRDARDIIRPGKGSVVEVLVLWKERVLSTYHFHDKGSITIGGSSKADVIVPILSGTTEYQLLKIQGAITVCLNSDMTGELIRDRDATTFAELAKQGKLRGSGSQMELDLRQGEMARVYLQDTVAVMIRYKTDSPKPVIAPLLDLSTSEVTGVILAGVISAIFALYMSLYAPSSLLDDEANVEEPIRKAVVTFHPPKPIVTEEAEPTPPKPVEKKVVQVKEQAKQIKADVKSTEIKAPHKQEASKQSVAKAGDPGKAGDVAPRPEPKKNQVTSSRPGGAIKTAPKDGANMKSDKPDPSKMGLLSVFGSKGAQSKLDKTFSGSGELQGMADRANGLSGSGENRAGDTMGTKLKDTGGGGKGTNTIGIAGVGTNGRGTGTTGYGTGGLGSKGSVKVDVGGQDADFQGSIDREAIRRVILAHKAEIRFCYDKELQKDPNLAGKVTIGWNIGEDGRVTRAGVNANALGSDAVANCIVNKLKTWTFPPAPPDVEAKVSYPFVFSSN